MCGTESLGASSPEEGLPAAWGWVIMHLSGAGNGDRENLLESLSLGAGVYVSHHHWLEVLQDVAGHRLVPWMSHPILPSPRLPCRHSLPAGSEQRPAAMAQR